MSAREAWAGPVFRVRLAVPPRIQHYGDVARLDGELACSDPLEFDDGIWFKADPRGVNVTRYSSRLVEVVEELDV